MVVNARNLEGRNIRVNCMSSLTEPFAAPEVVIDDKDAIYTFNEKVDIWSLGMTLFSLGNRDGTGRLLAYTDMSDLKQFRDMRKVLRVVMHDELNFDTNLQDFIEKVSGGPLV